MVCGFCGIETTNPKYCSKSCAAKSNNRLAPKRKKSVACLNCGTLIAKQRGKHCAACRPRDNLGDITLDTAIYKKHHRSSAYALVRTRARAVVRLRPQVCEVCGYDKHVQACHVKGIGEFSGDTLISVINHPSNLRVLCPNCHWEFDHR